MSMRPNLHFPGTAGDVLAHYRAAFGGETEITHFGGSPVAGTVPPDWADKILYARLHTPYGEIDLMDAPPGRAAASGGNVAIAIDLDDEAEAARIFEMLSDGGTIQMPFESAFFARKFGMVDDRFGVSWMISVAPVPLATM